MKARMKVVGWRDFDDTPVTVTDPCYKRGTWCTVDNVKILPGRYNCVAYKVKKWDVEDGKRQFYERVSGAAVYHSDYMNKMGCLKRELIGEAGVDAGLCGFYQNKPDYSDEEWGKFCGKISNMDYLITEEGFCTSSGYGDGCYDVYARRNENGEIVGLEIDFI